MVADNVRVHGLFGLSGAHSRFGNDDWYRYKTGGTVQHPFTDIEFVVFYSFVPSYDFSDVSGQRTAKRL